jgi:LemA protein
MTALVIAALLFFWAVGAYNRLVRLRAACAQQFAVVDAQFVRLWAWVQGSLPASVRDEDAAMDKADADKVPTALTEIWTACEAFAESLAQARANPLAVAPLQRVNIARVQLFKLLRQEKDVHMADETSWFSAPLQKKFERLKTQAWPMIVAYNQTAQTYNDAVSEWPARWLARQFRFEAAAKLDSADPLA